MLIGQSDNPQSFPGYPTQDDGTDGLWTHTERYWVATRKVSVTLPARGASTNQDGSTVTDPDGNTLYCQGRRIDAGPAPGISVVELTYVRDQTTYSVLAPEDNPRRVELRGAELAIDDKRLLTSEGGKFTATQIANAKNAGYKTLPNYQAEYIYTDVNASFAWTQAAIVASLQDTGAPTGMVSATASDWRRLGSVIQEQEDATIIETHWEYAGPGFYPLDS